MRRAARIDSNQVEVVRVLRAAGCKVKSLAAVGDGLPDLLVGYRRRLSLLEVKDGCKVNSKQRLTDDEQKFHDEWEGYPIFIVSNPIRALIVVGVDVEVARCQM